MKRNRHLFPNKLLDLNIPLIFGLFILLTTLVQGCSPPGFQQFQDTSKAIYKFENKKITVKATQHRQNVQT
jgi:hypothetical protein